MTLKKYKEELKELHPEYCEYKINKETKKACKKYKK